MYQILGAFVRSEYDPIARKKAIIIYSIEGITYGSDSTRKRVIRIKY